MNVIVYTRPDGGMTVSYPVRNINEPDVSEEFIIQRAWSKIPPDAIEPRLIFTEDIPQDRTFRDAWEHDGEKVRVNMDKARVIHMNRIRKVRDKVLADLDIETIKALGQGDKIIMDAVEGQKRRLRNLPQTFDLSKAKTPEELQTLWPDELKGFL